MSLSCPCLRREGGSEGGREMRSEGGSWENKGNEEDMVCVTVGGRCCHCGKEEVALTHRLMHSQV